MKSSFWQNFHRVLENLGWWERSLSWRARPSERNLIAMMSQSWGALTEASFEECARIFFALKISLRGDCFAFNVNPWRKSSLLKVLGAGAWKWTQFYAEMLLKRLSLVIVSKCNGRPILLKGNPTWIFSGIEVMAISVLVSPLLLELRQRLYLPWKPALLNIASTRINTHQHALRLLKTIINLCKHN